MSILHIYTRVSTEIQSEEGYSLSNQEKMGVEYSKREGFSSYQVWNEGGVSGGGEKIEEREVLTILLDKVKSDEVKDIFVQDISRLSRHTDTSHEILKILRDTQSNLHTSSGKISFSTPEDILRYNILSSISTYENGLRREKITQGVKSRFLDGKSHSARNYGYTTDEDGKLIPDEKETQVYLRIVRMTIEGKSPYEIGGILNDEGISPPILSNRIKTGRKPKEDKLYVWNVNTIDRLLKSPLYKGKRYYHGIDKKEKIETQVPPLIDEITWDNIQTSIQIRVKTGKKRQRKNPYNIYLLKGLCLCRKCGNGMWSKIRRKNGKITENTYYCRKKNAREKRNKGSCNLKSINRVMLEDVLWNTLVETLSNSNTRKEEVKKRILGENVDDRNDMIEKLKKETESLSRQIKTTEESLIELARRLVEGRVDEVMFDSLKKGYDERISETKKSLLDRQQHLSLIENDDEWVDWINSFDEEMDSLKGLNDTEGRQPIVDKYVREIWIDYDENTKTHDVSIYLRFPIVDDSFRWKVNINNELERDEKGRRVGEVVEGEDKISIEGLYYPKHKNLYCTRCR